MIINFELVLPVYYNQPGELNIFDLILFIVGVFFIGFQLVADQQQWDFQLRKKLGGELEQNVGFIRNGLWKYSRHPNYFAELGL